MRDDGADQDLIKTIGHALDARVYVAKVNSDTSEGRGPTRTVGTFFEKNDAQRSVIGKDVMGSDGEVEQVSRVVVSFWHSYRNEIVTHVVGEPVFSHYDADEETRKRALAKLTSEEKKALGLG